VQHYWLDHKFVLIFAILFCSLGITAQEIDEPASELDYNLQVVKFYFEKQEYETVLNYIDDLNKESYVTDSLKYYQALSYDGLGRGIEASDVYSNLLIHSFDKDLNRRILTHLELSLQDLPVSFRIDKISQILNELRTDDQRTDLLFMLAEIYEEAHFFEEANDVYRTILSEVDAIEQFTLDFKIAANFIFLKDYESALNILEPIVSLQDSVLNKDALFLSFLANHSLNRFNEARLDLIELYQNYPEHNKRFEILSALADIYFQDRSYIASWFILEELMTISDASQLYLIEKKIVKIKELISEEGDLPPQFQNFKLDLRSI
jgi:hypothetical protein